jgi:glycosyltransferase involved in cell wall biosynthesis
LLDAVAALRSDSAVQVSVLAFAEGPLLPRVREFGAQTQVIEPPSALARIGESGGAGRGALAKVIALAKAITLAPGAAKFLTQLRLAIARSQPDVVHTNGMKAHLLAGVVTPLHSRLVVHLHDFIGARPASKMLLPLLARIRRDATFIANSHAVAEDFRGLAPAADIRVIHNVVDTDYFSPAAAEPEWLASCAGLAPPEASCVSFGLIATYARWKGHGLFIEAAGKLRAKHPELPFRFYVVGGPIYDTIGSQVRASELLEAAQGVGIADCFGLVPFQDDIARVYRSLSVVVHASTSPEPFGRTIVEAMACERPVLVASAGGAAELFQHRDNALGFVLGSADSLAEVMSEVLDASTRERLAHSARRHALSVFSLARLGPELLAAYQPRSSAALT